MALALLMFFLVQMTYASPPSAPEGNGTAEPSRPQVAEKRVDNLSSATKDLSAAILPTASDKNEKDAREVETKSLQAEIKIADETEKLSQYTDRLAYFTRLLVVVGAMQIVIFCWQLVLMNKAAEDSGRSAKAALRTANLAREEFLTTHRPKIRVRRVALEEAPLTAEISIRYEIVNIGTRPAHIFGGITQIVFWQNPQDRPLPPFADPLDTHLYNVRGAMIEPGARHSEIVAASDEVGANFQFARSLPNSSNLYFIGFIKYRDDLDTIRETSFCRRLEQTGFSKVDHPDYEYED
jgi:hypothetical protein